MTVQQHNRQQQDSVPSTIVKNKQLIAEALPKHLDPERFMRLALTTLRKTPALQRCDPQSFVGALLTASALGLEPDVNGEAYLVPYKNECTLIIGYQGLAKMFWQHPLAASLSAEYVCERDVFEYEKGTNPRIRHIPALGDRGPVIAYYASVGLKNGASWFDVFTPAQIAKLRGSSRKGQIADPEHWMERKTALRQVLKLAPKSVQLASLDAYDERPGSIDGVKQMVAERRDGTRPELPPHDDTPPRDEMPPHDADTGEVYEGELVEPEPDGAMFPEGGER